MDRETLYKLTPGEFEQLCIEILKAQGFKFVRFIGVPGSPDLGADIIAQTTEGYTIIQVTHTLRLSRIKIRQDIVHALQVAHEPKEILIITSAAVTAADREFVQAFSSQGVPVRLLGQDDVLEILAKYPDIDKAIVSPARNRERRQQWKLWSGIISVFVSIMAGLLSTMLFEGVRPLSSLDQQIETVEKAIGSLKNLEQYLTDIKKDMVNTERTVRAIEEDYAKAKELKKMTEAQFNAIKSALLSRNWQQTVINYVIGFVLGVASSLTASVVYSRWKQRRALSQ